MGRAPSRAAKLQRAVEPVLWDLDDHTRAKHRVLRAYLDAWIPILAYQAKRMAVGKDPPRLLLVDGFAGPGRYATGEPGSPLIMLDALLDHQAFPSLGGVEFIFLFIESDPRRVSHLEGELAKRQLPSNVKCDVVEGHFEDTFGEVVDEVRSRGNQLVPTFAFIDPFGYSAASMSLAGRFLYFPRCELLFFLPLTHIARFVGRAGQEQAMTSLFNTDRWKEAIDLSGLERREFLLELFEEQLRAEVEHVRSFELHTKDGNDYRLVFASGHQRGLEAIKDAMWSVDPEEGTRYIARTDDGQAVLFAGENVDTRPLLDHLRARFGHDWFTIEQAEQVTLAETPFRKGHLKQMTLKPAVDADELEVQRPKGKTHGFTPGTRLRFSP